MIRTAGFSDLHNLVRAPAAGVDGESVYYVEKVLGVEKFLAGLREELRSGTTLRSHPYGRSRLHWRGGVNRRRGQWR